MLAQGRPASPPRDIPALVRADGAFRDTPIRNGLRYAWAYVRAAGRAQLAREIDAQLRRSRHRAQLAHVDGHLNMHLHPMVLPILLELAPRYGIRAMRVSRESLQRGAPLRPRGTPLRKCFEGVAFHALAAYAAPRLRAAGIVSSERVFGMHQTGHVDEATSCTWSRRCRRA